ncbi:hypothetical protein BpHYR1_007324 [Brachionus plicatilis]|uniref:Uncharacterized protein n=1 Tax=Brachionus plicatilis TaxID=10195 RepID=A0A3M7P5G8_BRAPC|nr:hypothetical protein BpHYR1_007324 [Brachionus plicatilis]
MGIKSWLRKA